MNVISNHRPVLSRSEYQPNLLEYIDTTLNESSIIHRTIAQDGRDQFGNTILDQYLLYLLCQKIEPDQKKFYRLLHRLIIHQGYISKGFFEYSPPSSSQGHQRSIYQRNFRCYTNFIWNEFSVNTLLEIGCFLLKYRLNTLFLPSCDPHGFYLEIFIIYYLSTHRTDAFVHSRSSEMIFPSPSLDTSNSSISTTKPDEHQTFQRLLVALEQNGEFHFDRDKILSLLQTDSLQFIQRKLSNDKRDFLHFLQTVGLLLPRYPRSLKSFCRQLLKISIRHYPDDICRLNCNASLQRYLVYDNSFLF